VRNKPHAESLKISGPPELFVSHTPTTLEVPVEPFATLTQLFAPLE
jgi:hypothetical protein